LTQRGAFLKHAPRLPSLRKEIKYHSNKGGKKENLFLLKLGGKKFKVDNRPTDCFEKQSKIEQSR